MLDILSNTRMVIMQEMIFIFSVFAFGLSLLALISTFDLRKISTMWLKISEKIWGGRTPDEVLSKRYKLFVFFGIFLIGMFAVYRYFIGITFLPNFEWIIPVLVVTGSFSLHLGPSKFWRTVTRYFGVLSVISAFIVWFIMFGILPIHAFVWSGFVFAWLFAMRKKLSMFDKFKTLLGHTLVTTAFAILLFDFWTGVVGFSLLYTSLWAAFIGQIPFTFYHLCSLVFVPPLVGLGKLLVKVKVPISVPVAVGAEASVPSKGVR